MVKAIIISVLVLIGALRPGSVYAAKTYDAPESFTQRPSAPDIRKNEGADIYMDRWIMTVEPQTFAYDVYVQFGCRKKTFPLRLGPFWQVTDICEFWPRSHFNRAVAEVQRSWKLTYRYTSSTLEIVPGFSFPEDSLRIAYSADGGETWTMLKNAVVDTTNDTLAVVTDKPGGYVIMAGFGQRGAYYSYAEVKGESTSRGTVVGTIKWLLEWLAGIVI